MPDAFHSASESLERSRSAIVAAFVLSAIAASRAGPIEATDLMPFCNSLVGADPALFAEDMRSCSDQSSHISANCRQVRCASRSEAYCAAARHSSALFLQSSAFIFGISLCHTTKLYCTLLFSYVYVLQRVSRLRLAWAVSTLSFRPQGLKSLREKLIKPSRQ